MSIHTLQQIAAVFREDIHDYAVLTQSITDFKALCLALSEIDIETDEAKKHLYFENGKAVGRTWAAFCIDDILRTKMFIKGLFKAIEQLKSQKKETIHVLYAGSGPFATLILPIMAVYSPEEIQFTLLEINQLSAESAERVIHKLGFERYIRAIEQQDATKYVIKGEVDIVLSETMQKGLVQEQQVPIAMNLMRQVSEKTLLIPEKISLDIALINNTKLFERQEDTPESEYCLRLGSLFELSAEKIANYNSKMNVLAGKMTFPTNHFSLPKESLETHSSLAILTEIVTFGAEKLSLNESGLCTPIILTRFSKGQNLDKQVSIYYKIDKVPGFEYTIS